MCEDSLTRVRVAPANVVTANVVTMDPILPFGEQATMPQTLRRPAALGSRHGEPRVVVRTSERFGPCWRAWDRLNRTLA